MLDSLTPVRLSDAPQRAVAHCTLTETISRGTRVRLAADSLRSVMSGLDADSVAVSLMEDGSAAWPVLGGVIPRPQPQSGVDRAPRQVVLTECPGAAKGAEVAVAVTFQPQGAGRGAKLGPYAEVPITFRLEALPEGADHADETAWRPVSGWFGFVPTAGEPDHLEAFLDAHGQIAAGVFDRYVNPVPAAGAGADFIEAIDPDGTAVAVPLPAADSGLYAAARVPLPAPPAPGTRIQVRDARGRTAESAPAPFRATPEGDRLLFGEFHWHTEASGDGARPLADSYRSARDGLLLDFAGAADHFPFDPPPSRYAGGLSLRECAEVVDGFDAPGRFATLLGIELSWRMGHYNFYWADRDELDLFLEAWEARRPGPLAGTITRPPDGSPAPDIASFYGLPADYFERTHPGRTLVIPHHTNVTSNNLFTPNGMPMWTQYHWPLGHYDPRFFRLGEMVQARGAFETEELNPAWKVRSGGGGGSLRTALARGFRIGFTGGTDNHSGWPGRQVGGIGASGSSAGGWVGLTGVYAPEHSRAGIMRGLYNRRCYATTGVRMVVDFRLDGAPMGSELQLGPGEERRFALRVHGTAPLERVEIVSHGVTIASLPVDGPDLVTEWVDERRGRPVHDVYYYLRVRQPDGHCAWASPIWVDIALPSQETTDYGGYGAYAGPVAWS